MLTTNLEPCELGVEGSCLNYDRSYNVIFLFILGLSLRCLKLDLLAGMMC